MCSKHEGIYNYIKEEYRNEIMEFFINPMESKLQQKLTKLKEEYVTKNDH